MPTTLTGSAADPTANPTATAPLDGDPANASSVNGAFQALLNFISWIRGRMVRNDADNTVNGTTTFNNPVNVATATADTHAVQKTQLDLEIYNRQQNDALEQTNRQNADNLKANLSGADFTGPVTVQTPTAAANPARKDYVDGLRLQMARAWANVTLGASGMVTVNAGFNVSSGSWSNTGQRSLNVNFAVPLANTNYVATIMPVSSIYIPAAATWAVLGLYTSGLSFTQYHVTTMVGINYAQGEQFLILVFGNQ